MIKGINRQMIEVTHTGSPYFERAFLVVRSGDEVPSPERLHRMAEKVVQQAETYAGLKVRHRRLWVRRILLAVASAGIGATLMWGIQQLF